MEMGISWCKFTGNLNKVVIFTSFTILLTQVGSSGADGNGTASNSSSSSTAATECNPGLLLPVWQPQLGLSTGNRVVRGCAYFLALAYMFLGVSIVSDRFMGAIEVITSREHEMKIKKSNGEVQVVTVRIWNETVANLTLMALGSSAPEILLSIIEIIGSNFEAGDLGPGTIVGSAAFNLLIIIGLCILVIPANEIRRIKHLRVFFVTATWSIFAYLWLFIILKFISPGEVEWWEGLVTFLCFPLTVGSAYIADRRLLIYKYLSKSYHRNKRGMIVEGEGKDSLTDIGKLNFSTHGMKVHQEEEENEEVAEFEQSRRDYIQLLHELRKANPDITPEKLEELAREEIMSKAPKSRAYYRIQATRKLVGGQNLVKKMQKAAAGEQTAAGARKTVEGPESKKITRIFFDPAHYTVLENVGKFPVTVVREGGDLNKTVLVDYQTEDGTASAGTDYFPVIGTLTFQPGELFKTISLEVIDDEEFEEDEHFYLRLSKPRFGGQGKGASGSGNEYSVQLTSPFLATIMILDDDHGGIFSVGEKDIETNETCGIFEIKITRGSGARGKVSVNYCTVEGTAKGVQDFEPVTGAAVFENNETEKIIPIKITDTDSYEKDAVFYFDISEPTFVEPAMKQRVETLQKKSTANLTKEDQICLQGLPKLGNDIRATVHIKENKEFKDTVDRLVQQTNTAKLVGTSSWIEQFKEAFSVREEGDDEDEGKPEKVPSILTYVMHFLTVFWKVLFAFIPPTDILGGYLCFICSILAIGLLTALIGDIASHFGCSVGLKDGVTSIVFVALGTSIPDTFASKVAAIQDEYADASIGNVTGSNAVNVFLGLGIAWTVAALYHGFIKGRVKNDLCENACPHVRVHGQQKNCHRFCVAAGSLGFSVSLFCACAFVAILVMMVRRMPIFGGGELGGPRRFKISTGILFFALWLFYVVMSSLESYSHVPGF